MESKFSLVFAILSLVFALIAVILTNSCISSSPQEEEKFNKKEEKSNKKLRTCEVGKPGELRYIIDRGNELCFAYFYKDEGLAPINTADCQVLIIRYCK